MARSDKSDAGRWGADKKMREGHRQGWHPAFFGGMNEIDFLVNTSRSENPAVVAVRNLVLNRFKMTDVKRVSGGKYTGNPRLRDDGRVFGSPRRPYFFSIRVTPREAATLAQTLFDLRGAADPGLTNIIMSYDPADMRTHIPEGEFRDWYETVAALLESGTRIFQLEEPTTWRENTQEEFIAWVRAHFKVYMSYKHSDRLTRRWVKGAIMAVKERYGLKSRRGSDGGATTPAAEPPTAEGAG